MKIKTAIFGYGSLIFKPPPFANLDAGRIGYIKEHRRRFAQSSSDHRGTPESPGRVVTLISNQDWNSQLDLDEPEELDTVYGRIYTFTGTERETALYREYMDHREKDGYSLRLIDVFAVVDGKEIIIEADCQVYVGEIDNPSYVGWSPMNELAERIASSSGPSGRNCDYLYQLCDAIRSISTVPDAYLTDLESLVKLAVIELN